MLVVAPQLEKSSTLIMKIDAESESKLELELESEFEIDDFPSLPFAPPLKRTFK